MRPQYSIVTQPDLEPITLAQASEHLRVDSEADQDYVTSLIPVARELVDSITGRVSILSEWLLVAATWDDLLEGASEVAKIYRTPLVSVQYVKYYAEDDSSLTTMPESDYRVIKTYEPGLIQFIETLPDLEDRPDAIQIAFTAGYDTQADIPAIHKHASKVVVSDMYEQRGSISFGQPYEIKPVLRSLLENQKVTGWVA